ncbi:DNA polymerase III subunit gamma/tau [Bacteroidia bacterium]|nr:DNA polymerase III subunit gamma/tau [Bacteroidia bacterium]
MAENFVVSARKYRPQTFDTVIGQAAITSTLKNSITRQHLAHAYLFCGPRGVGKTTCARIFAKTINCLSPINGIEACDECESCKSFKEQRSYCIHELDAASHNGVEDIRDLNEQVRIPPQVGKYSVYIIDEVHMLSPAAFNAFLKTLEEPPAHAIFILATTEKNKILPTILSRCQVYDFKRIRVEDTVEFLKNICTKEGVQADERALHVIAQKADGAMRDALSIFDQVVSFCGNTLAYEQVIDNLNVLDSAYYFQLTDSFLAHDYQKAMLLFDDILSRGFDAQPFMMGLCTHFRNLLMCKDASTAILMEATESVKQQYVAQAAQTAVEWLLEALNAAGQCAATYKSSSQQRFHVELCLLNITNIGNEKKKSEPITIIPKETEKPSAPPAAKQTAPYVAEIAPTTKTVETQKNDLSTNTQFVENQDFTENNVKNILQNYAQSKEQNNVRLINAIETSTMEVAENFKVRCVCNNAFFYEAIDEAKESLTAHLQSTFNNKSITLAAVHKQEAKQEKNQKPYLPIEQFNYFAEKNNSLLTLKEKFGLEF